MKKSITGKKTGKALPENISRLEQEAVQRAKELTVLFEIGKTVTSNLGFDLMIARLEAGLKKLVDADAALFVITNDRKQVEIMGGGDLKRRHPVPVHHDLCQDVATDVAATGKARSEVCLPNCADCRFAAMARDDGGTHHVASVPLIRQGKPIGSMSVLRQNRPSFSGNDLRLLKTFASVAAIAVANSLAFERERRVAETLQTSLLPRPNCKIPGFAIGTSFQSATEESKIGGDVYDVVPLGSGRYGILIADVSGKGVDAAVHTAMVKYLARGLLMSGSDLPTVLVKLNEAACQDLPSDIFITLFLGVLDADRRELVYVNAGHEQPLFYVSKHGCCIPCDVTGRALGVVERSKYATRKMTFESGDLLVLYTDGVTEARCGGEFLGVEGLERLLSENVNAPPAVMVRRVFKGVSKFAKRRLQDDAALLVIKAL